MKNQTNIGVSKTKPVNQLNMTLLAILSLLLGIGIGWCLGI
jgi:hypothetical protein